MWFLHRQHARVVDLAAWAGRRGSTTRSRLELSRLFRTSVSAGIHVSNQPTESIETCPTLLQISAALQVFLAMLSFETKGSIIPWHLVPAVAASNKPVSSAYTRLTCRRSSNMYPRWQQRLEDGHHSATQCPSAPHGGLRLPGQLLIQCESFVPM